LIQLFINIKVDSKAKQVEQVLPDALQIMSANLKAGLTVDQALLASAKPEFGIFEKEMNRIGKEITTGKEIEFALQDSTKRIRSEKYKKTVDLIVSGLRSGGRLSELLSQTSDNLRKQGLIDEKIRSSVMMYSIFIFTAIAFGAPVLFGLSSFLVKVLGLII
jgi:Flp pilus assembly protein TadB